MDTSTEKFSGKNFIVISDLAADMPIYIYIYIYITLGLVIFILILSQFAHNHAYPDLSTTSHLVPLQHVRHVVAVQVVECRKFKAMGTKF